MSLYPNTTEPHQCKALITISKSGLRFLNNTNVYLKQHEYFEIELYNPTLYDVLANITINGRYLISRYECIVVPAGKKIVVTRFVDSGSRFMFVGSHSYNIKIAFYSYTPPKTKRLLLDNATTTYPLMVSDSLPYQVQNMGRSVDFLTGECDPKESPFVTYKYQLLPVEVSMVQSYCTECGGEIEKPSWKFCPACGNALTNMI